MSKTYKSNYDRIQDFLRTHPVVRARDLRALGMDGCDLRRGVRRGWFTRVGRGLYLHRRATPTEHQALQMAALRTPHATFCLETALHLHGLVETRPATVWLGLTAKARRPRSDDPGVRIVWLTGAFERLQVEVRDVDGVSVTLLTPAAAIVHAFARGDLVPEGVAVDALRALLERDRLQELLVARFAARCRVLGTVAQHLPGRAFECDVAAYPAPPPVAHGIDLRGDDGPPTTIPPTTLPPEEWASTAA